MLLRLLSACGFAALLAGAVPLALGLDTSELVQDGVFARRSQQLEQADQDEASADWQEKHGGQLLTLTVRPVFGPDISVSTRSLRPLQDLEASIATKTGTPLETLTFKHNGRTLDKAITPAKLRITDGYVIEVSSKTLWAKRLKQLGSAAQEAREKLQMAEQVRAEAAAEEKRRKDATAAAALLEEQEKSRIRQSKGTISLRFISPRGGEDVVMIAKKREELGTHFKLVAKRMNLATPRFVLRRDHGPMGIGPHDTPEELGIKDGGMIFVKAL